MTESTQTASPASSASTSASMQAPSLREASSPSGTVSAVAPQALSSIRGVPSCESIRPDQLAPDSAFDETYSRELNKLWVVARLDTRVDRGGDLRRLIELFESDPGLGENVQLISQLYRVATTETLFGKSRADFAQEGMDFDKIRREFLVDIIRGTIDSDNITQGKEPLCTIASACKLLPKEEFLRLATDLALRGSSTTASGAEITIRPEFFQRAHHCSEAELGDVKCARRSMGTLMMLYGVLQLGDQQVHPAQPLIDRQQGLYSHQYTRMVQNLLGEKIACAHRSADNIAIDPKTSRPVQPGTEGAKELRLFQYVESQLQRGKPVFIDTVFDFSSHGASSGSEHCRHALIAESFETIDGVRWVRCSNPIGDFVNTSQSRSGYAEFFAKGTTLGTSSGFWFKTAENGDILVRADILRDNIQTALVQYEGEAYKFKAGDTPQFIGNQLEQDAAQIEFFEFQHDVSEIEERLSTAETIVEKLDKLFKQQEAFGAKAALVDTDEGYQRSQVPVRKKTYEEEALEQIGQVVEAKRHEEEKEKKEIESAEKSEQKVMPSQPPSGISFVTKALGLEAGTAPLGGPTGETTAIASDMKPAPHIDTTNARTGSGFLTGALFGVDKA